jgi:hypothetical protein
VAAQAQEDSGAFVAVALGVPEASIQLDGTLTQITAADGSLFRVGDDAASASPAIIVERGAYANLEWEARPDALFGAGGAFDCTSPRVACPSTELRLERFDQGASLFVWDIAGAVQRPTGSQILRVAVLANDPRYPLLNDARPNTPFAGVNKVWVMDYTETAETMRFFQVDGGQLREFRTDAISGFNGSRTGTSTPTSWPDRRRVAMRCCRQAPVCFTSRDRRSRWRRRRPNRVRPARRSQSRPRRSAMACSRSP